MVCAGLEGQVECRSLCLSARLAQGDDLSVRSTILSMVSRADHRTIPHDDRPDEWVRIYSTPSPLGQFESIPDPAQILGCPVLGRPSELVRLLHTCTGLRTQIEILAAIPPKILPPVLILAFGGRGTSILPLPCCQPSSATRWRMKRV